MAATATPPLIEQWAVNIGANQPIEGSWIEAIAKKYEAPKLTGDRLADIASKLGVDLRLSSGDHYQDIAKKLNSRAAAYEGSWLGSIVRITTPA